jgi:hypothetical protein
MDYDPAGGHRVVIVTACNSQELDMMRPVVSVGHSSPCPDQSDACMG